MKTGIEPLMTAPEVAALVRKSTYTVRQMARLGVIIGRRVGRDWLFRRGDVSRFIEGRAK